ncbi:MAG: DNA gyrase subunit A [Planctomycetota bacterium]|nr:MAG: DNA gyrase subunit A [Planctomycetota bacterium]
MPDPKDPKSEDPKPPSHPPGGNVIPTLVEEEMKDSYLNYSMSVIVSRALPDVRDGLKPSQRRILVAMNDLGLGPRAKPRKCAKICGDTSGNYHPHGESVVYPTLVRLAQDFATRYLLVRGQGNFGNIDGDPPAAMRYTEARMTEHATLMLEDMDKATVDFVPNYDERLEEPVVLPSKFPNLICNGGVGIAVGMATSIPPHNLAEVCDALVHLIAHPDATTADLMKFIPGPDFPTGGIIHGTAGLRNAYETGRGHISVRGRVEIEEAKNGRKTIAIVEIPYNLNKTNLIERIAELVKEDHIGGISDVRDLSSRDGMRIEIEIRKGEDVDVILNQLYAMTPLQETFSIIMIALVNGRPETLPLKKILYHYLEHRKEVIRRRTRFLLEQAEKDAHILEGLVKALDIIDEIIALIKRSASPAIAQKGLIEEFGFTVVQADAILRMTLSKLTGLEREKLVKDLAELRERIAEYKAILADVNLVYDIIREDLYELRKTADKRRTELSGEELEAFNREELIQEEDVVVVLSHQGYIKRVPMTSYRKQKRGGKGLIGADVKEKDFIEQIFIASTHDYLMFFTQDGKVRWQKVYDLPALERTARGKPISAILGLKETDRIAATVAAKTFEKGFLVMATERGVVKKTELAEYGNPRPSGIIAIKLEEGDKLIGAAITTGESEVVLGTADGMSIRFKDGDMRPMGRATVGVYGIDLEEGDKVVDMIVLTQGVTILTACEHGYGKRSEVEEYRLQSRGGKGVINIRTTDRNGKVVGMLAVTDNDDLIMISEGGIVVRIAVKDIRSMGRATQGVRFIRLDEGDKLVSVARVIKEDDGETSVIPKAQIPPPDEGSSVDVPPAPPAPPA